MTFEPFHCTFVGDTQGFKVSPVEGTLERRGGDVTELEVSYKGNVRRAAALVVVYAAVDSPVATRDVSGLTIRR